MDRLWAPWRINYLRSKKKPSGCIFCRAKRSKGGGQVIFKSRNTVCLLNIYPYNNGHLLIAPLRHVADPDFLSDDEMLDIFHSLKRAKKLLRKVLAPQGYNIGFNLGAQAGAGITGHLHLHVVPRWAGDTNFMPVLSGNKVISQSLRELAGLLKDADKQNR
ncbi:MAG: HIT domain-containing protein [Candidatus Omnitrophica bacterium]|jgi:ATP adenylyltransferase|nr:HIT domain-containing protein [Candidatus Omnitrophota bacterium]MDD3274313.1 HIT domain-containing protein [Candidatus Omnitrophota bacterium]MDD5077387.1 HIT domain-containing protein [Candidatus Omnitrophota bacterium]MDD5724815.1 HIT domain-containing protein [Candidatus Omnitrophota bacterium]